MAEVPVVKTSGIPTPEKMWDNFIEHLNKTEPLLPKYKVVKGKRVMVSSEPHRAFLGSIDAYRVKFLEANKPRG